MGDGNILADVGTDHGYVPIYLLEQKRIPRAIAMDINRGPLTRAEEHIRLYGMQDYIETRLSDGVEALAEGEAEAILIAGMGGGLVIHILTAGENICKGAGELILQPQSELSRVRKFLDENGYAVDREDMILEEGKYYPMMRVCYDPHHIPCASAEKELFYAYGELLLKNRHPVLMEYLEKERRVQSGILEKLKQQPKSGAVDKRIREVEHVFAQNDAASCYAHDCGKKTVTEPAYDK